MTHDSSDTAVQLADNPDLDLISSLLADLRQMRHVMRHGIEPKDLIDPHAATLFTVMSQAYRSGRSSFEPADVQRAFQDSQSNGWQRFVGAALRRHAASEAELYAVEIRHRQLRSRATQVLDDAKHQLETLGSAEQAIGSASTEMAKLYSEAKPPHIDTVSDASLRAIEQIKAAQQRKESLGVPTGFADLDDWTGGMFPGEFVVLAARPSIGKTSLAVHIAMNIAKRARSVALFSFEMRNTELAMRILSSMADIPLQDIRRQCVTSDQVRRLEAKTTESVEWPFYLFDDPRMTVDQVSAFARMLHDEKPLSAVVVDYLTLMPGTKGTRSNTTTEAISIVTSNLKQLAQILECPVLVLSQLNREGAKDEKPKLHHLRDSGAIEQDADQVWLLSRTGDDETLVEVDVAKNRNGETGPVTLKWEKDYTRFSDRDARSFENYETAFEDWA